MLCEHVRRDLMDYHHGRLSPQERAAIEDHLSNCEACTEEATSMKEIGNLLSRGLKDWVDQGTCPSDVAERIERVLKPRQRSWWQRWPAAAAVAAAAAAVLLVVLSTQPQMANQMASVPLVGALAASLVSPDIEIQVDPRRPVTASLFRPVRTVDMQNVTVANGITITVDRVATDAKMLRVQYTVKGDGLEIPSDQQTLEPRLISSAGPIRFLGLTADRKGEEIRFVAYFEAVPEGERLTLTVPALAIQRGDQKGPVTLTFTN